MTLALARFAFTRRTYVSDVFDHRTALYLTRRQVDAHGDVGRVVMLHPPLTDLETSLLQDPASYGHDLSRFLGRWDEVQWRDEPLLGMIPSEQRLDA